jgi:putative transposase
VLNQTWALDFMTETLYDSRRVRLLTVIDEGNRKGLEIVMGMSLPSRRVVRVLNELVALYGRPTAVNTHVFESIAELRALTDAWLRI